MYGSPACWTNCPKAQAIYGTAVFGLHSYLSIDSEKSIGLRLGPSLLDSMVAATTRFNRHLFETPEPILEAVLLATENQPRPVRREVFLELSEFICAPDRDFEIFQALFCTDGHGVDPLPEENDLWHSSALLPFLLIEGRLADLKRLLWSLDKTENRWISVSLAWTLRQSVVDDGLDEADREEVVYSVLKVIRHLANNYWSQAHCVVLIEAVASLLGHRG